MLIRCSNIVATMKAKFLQIRIREDIKADFQTVAALRGLSVSALVHSLIVKAIREEKERDPKAFQTKPKGIEVAPRSKTGIPLMNHKQRRTADGDTAKKQKNKVA